MNQTEALLASLQAKGIVLSAENGKLKCKAPKGVLTEDIQQALSLHKLALLALLSAPSQADVPASKAPLSCAQQQLWFLYQLSPEQGFYNNPMAYKITGQLNPQALRDSFAYVIERHASLRTRFGQQDGQAFQEVLTQYVLPWQTLDWQSMGSSQRGQAIAATIVEDASRPFALETALPIRASLIQTAAEEWIWLVCVHHIVADGWSIGLLLSELMAAYQAFSLHEQPQLDVLPLQYIDYARQQQQLLTPEIQAEQLAYWKRQLGDAPALLPLPTDRPRPLIQRHHGQRHFCQVSRDVLARLQQLGREQQCTLFMLLQAGFSLILAKHANTQDVSMGTPFANRNRSELEPLIGHFINTVVLRNQPQPTQSLQEYLKAVRQMVLEAYENQDIPFEQVVEAINPERSTSYTPLFQVLLVLRNLPKAASHELQDVQITALDAQNHTAKFDLGLSITETEAGLDLEFEFNTDLFDPDTIARLAGHYTYLLSRMPSELMLPLQQLSWVPPEEQQSILQQFSRGPAAPAWSDEDVIHCRFEQQARRTPDAVAVVYQGQQYRYAELDRRASVLAARLLQSGVAPENCVALCLNRGLHMPVAILGVLKAGAAYVPMDPDYPHDRLQHMLQDSGATMVVVDDAGARALEGCTVNGLINLSQTDIGTQREPEMVLPKVSRHQLAYVIYTSGSTGKPKGVMVEHGSAVNFWRVMQGSTHEGLPVPSVVALNSAYTFDMSLKGWLQLLSGHSLHILPQEIRADGAALLAYFRQTGIAAFECTPTQLDMLLAEGLLTATDLPLQRVLIGGEPVSPPMWSQLRQAEAIRFYNMYGPTECTVDVTIGLINGAGEQPDIGSVITGDRVYILDEALRPVPVGVQGELYLAGAGLARGYLNQPELTQTRFVPDPFSPETGASMYRSGDLGRWRQDGRIEYIGRNDFQVKLRGFRIELGEIEKALMLLDDVREAVVLLDQTGEEGRLVAAVARPGDPASRSLPEWRALLLTALPAHMIPSVFVEFPKLPQTRNGKLDREQVLEAAQHAQGSYQVNLASPRDHIELRLYQIWKSLLLQPAISIRDNFFDIGGTSISAIKLAHRIKAEFNMDLPLHDILRYSSIEAMAGRLRQAEDASSNGQLVTLRAGEGKHNVVCIHPAGGTAFCYLSLAKVLPESCGVYGIQSPGIQPGEARLPSIEAMAEYYLQCITHLSAGPLVLTGLSFGGLVAYEMAARLVAEGHTQVSVVMLDTQGVDDETERADIAQVSMQEFRQKLIKFNGMYPGIEDEQIERYFTVYNHNRLTRKAYFPGECGARVVLIQAMGGRERDLLREGRIFWRQRASRYYRVHLVHGDHWEMLETAEILRVGKVLKRELGLLSSQVVHKAGREQGEALPA